MSSVRIEVVPAARSPGASDDVAGHEPPGAGPAGAAGARARRQSAGAGLGALHYARADGMLAAFQSVGCAAVLIDRRDIVLKFNAEARRHLGSAIAIVQRQLVASDRAAQPAFQRLLDGMEAPRGPRDAPCVVLRRAQGQPLLACAVPLERAGRERGGLKGIVLLIDPDRDRKPSASTLRQMFGLTPAEARLAAGLAAGLDLPEIARRHRVAVATLRVQLKSVFAKTLTKRQAELVALLARWSHVPRGL